MAQGFLVVFVVDLGEISSHFQAHTLSLMLAVCRFAVGESFKKMTHRHIQHQ